MTNFKTLAFSGLVLSLAATGWAHSQSTTLPAPPAATPNTSTGSMPPAPSTAQPGEEGDDLSLPGDEMNDDADDEDVSAETSAEPAAPESGETRGDRRGGPHRMGRMDANQDGAIGKDEFQGQRVERLRKADANGDGTLSKTELEAMVLQQIAERRAARLERRLDINGDGRVTLAEIESMRDKRFALYDRNDDGRLDSRELAALHRGMGPGEMRRGGDRHERPVGYGRHGERHGRHAGEGWHQRGHGWDRMPGGERGFD
ncbi:hypothetical protein ASG43_00960 [Aureimonas sp. Leaf454]|uniref:EF-hand domain-containing protein n=1 Tax=Aureimonas sp. Leaf454 TaxID=1736381 RepID=UPI0006F711FE|nr:hypothetical protein [Aureimonas sp. Leaf454]KQT54230.1 hypothetical protein ASG43_00960 [Aureimonas sp. Leaf454]